MSCQKPQSYKFDVCNVRFDRKDGLTRHQSKACKGANYKKCSVWSKEFSRLSSLKRHTLLHTNKKDQAKKFSYGICGNSYKREDFYKNHYSKSNSVLSKKTRKSRKSRNQQPAEDCNDERFEVSEEVTGDMLMSL